tara:strand:- start:8713 stop:9663 length:951 start_codon:yes stop_codon:yes gene_type:complete
MKILITGASGYLGGRLASSLESNNNSIHLVSRNKISKDKYKNISYSSSTIIDWEDQESLLKSVKGMDTVIHLAGMNAQDSIKDVLEADKVNEGNTLALLSAAIDSNVKNFLYLSTAHVYANPLEGSFNELSPINGDHPYATSHYLGEKAVLEAHKKKLINATIVRLSNAFGAPIHKDINCWMLLANDLCKQLAKNNMMVIRSSGEQRRNFITLTETARAIEHLIFNDIYYDNPVFNVGSDWNPKIKEIASLIASRFEVITGIEPSVEFGEGSDDAECKLDYSINKLKQSGFVPSPQSTFEFEIDLLIKSSIGFFGT